MASNTDGNSDAIADPIFGRLGTGGTDDISSGSVDPASGFDDGVTRNKDGSPRKKRGRKAGPNSAAKEKGASVDGIKSAIFSIHLILATTLKVPELALSQEESDAVARAIADVASHYPIAVDPKTMAWINLGMCLGTVYGTRAISYGIRKRTEKKEQVIPGQNIQQNVSPFRVT